MFYLDSTERYYENEYEAAEGFVEYGCGDPDVKPVLMTPCKLVPLHPYIKADHIIESLDDYDNLLPEDISWSNEISDDKKKELEEFLEKWCKSISYEVWFPDEDQPKIDITEEVRAYLKESNS